MNPNLLAIIVAFYLSKFDKQALKNLGFKNDSEAFESTAKILGVKRNYIKFRRDEFDPIHPWRKGWQRPMDKRVIKSIEALQDLDEIDLRIIVQQILNDTNYHFSEEIKQITALFSETKKEKIQLGKFILRAPTGRQAEDFFINHHSKYKAPVAGNLIDCRDFGVGYDFKVKTEKNEYFIEVKGTSDFSGGILFTNKEWSVARETGENYFLCIVSNLRITPQIRFIQNPFMKLNPQKNIYTTIQINWGVTAKQLTEVDDFILP